MVATLTRPATIETRQNRQWWTCPCCRKTLAEVFPDRVVIKVGDRRVTVAGDVVKQACPGCGAESQIGEVV